MSATRRFSRARKRALARGLRLIQLREKAGHSIAATRSRSDSCRWRIASAREVLLNGTADDARRLGCDGVHWTSAMLAQAGQRPAGMMVAASCHTRADVARAGALDLDFAVLGPVAATPTHPGPRRSAGSGFAALVEGTRVPVYALGGLRTEDLAVAVDHGAQGVALRRAAWPGTQASSGGNGGSKSSGGSTAGTR